MKGYRKIIPTIDIMGGKVVRLTQFDYDQKTEYDEDVLYYVEKFKRFKRIHIIDLDGVKTGSPQILDIIKTIREKYPKLEIEVGGGIRTHHDVKRYYELDCFIIVKTLLELDDIEFLKTYSHRLIYGCDVETKGKADSNFIEKIYQIRDLGIKNINITFKDLDGTLSEYSNHHFSINYYKDLFTRFDRDFNISIGGGVGSINDISYLIMNNLSCVVGKYLYENLDSIDKILSVEFLFNVSWSNAHKVYDGDRYIELVPVTLYNEREVLGQAWMNWDAVSKTLDTKDTKMLYLYSRSRNELWYKGETSGDYIPIDEISLDCDCDSILVKTSATKFCHEPDENSCFHNTIKYGDNYNRVNTKVLTDVYNKLVGYKTNPSESSYTCKLYKAGLEKILKKFGEESFELALAKTKEERLLEMCDVLYYLLVIASYDDIKMEDIFIEMENRRKK